VYRRRRAHGTNEKVSKLIQLERLARHELLVVSDADVRVPPDLLRQLASELGGTRNAIVCCLYRLANPSTTAMQWEAVSINSDFWSQVLQARTLAPLDFRPRRNHGPAPGNTPSSRRVSRVWRSTRR
jgi:hypothetical protein